MNSLIALEKIGLLFWKKPKGEVASSALSRTLKKQPRYNAKHLGNTIRKKSLREKWQSKRECRRQQDTLGRTRKRKSGGQQQYRLVKLVMVLGVVLFGGYLLVIGPLQRVYGNWSYFRIHDIEVSGCLMTTPGNLKKFANISFEMNMLTLDPEAMQERLQKHPWIAHADIKRIWPDGLAITVQEHRPNALIVNTDEDGLRYLDRKGKIFAVVAPGQDVDFPVITGLDVFNTDEEKERLLSEASSFLRLAERNNPNLPAQNISEIHFNSAGELIVYLVEQPFPIYIGKGDIKRKYYQLWKVLEVLYRKKKGKAIIDSVAYIRMDYQENKVLVARSHTG